MGILYLIMKRILITIVALGCLGLLGCEPFMSSNLQNHSLKVTQDTKPVLGSDSPSPVLSSSTPGAIASHEAPPPVGGSNR